MCDQIAAQNRALSNTLNATSAPGLSSLNFATATFSLRKKKTKKISFCVLCMENENGFLTYSALVQSHPLWVSVSSKFALVAVECYQFWLIGV